MVLSAPVTPPGAGPRSPAERVVITGMGLVTPLGCGVSRVWSRLLAGQTGVTALPAALAGNLKVRVAARVPDLAEDPEGGFAPERVVPSKDLKKMDRFILFALAAAEEALAQAAWHPETPADRERTGTLVASGIGGFATIAEAVRTTDQRGPERLSPFTVPAFLANLAAGQISIRHGLQGPLGAPVTACAASVQAVGDATRMIRAGEADVMVVGGAEACIHPVTLGAFTAARALSTAWEADPAAASRPFDQARDGFVVGEGAGMLVLESLAHALARGAQPLAEVLGYGTSADAYHITAAPEDGAGAARAMTIALKQAGLLVDAVDAGLAAVGHVNAHATSTPVGDRAELAALGKIFAGASPWISGTKAATGHLLGAAGAVEAIFTVLALRDQLAPPNRNLQDADPAAAGLRLVGPRPEPLNTALALSNGFGFGGVNASLLLGRYPT